MVVVDLARPTRRLMGRRIIIILMIGTVTIVCFELHCIRSHLAFFVWNDFGNSDILALDSRKGTAMAGEPRTATTARGSFLQAPRSLVSTMVSKEPNHLTSQGGLSEKTSSFATGEVCHSTSAPEP